MVDGYVSATVILGVYERWAGDHIVNAGFYPVVEILLK